MGQARSPVAFSDHLPTKVHASALHPRSSSTAGPPSLMASSQFALWSGGAHVMEPGEGGEDRKRCRYYGTVVCDVDARSLGYRQCQAAQNPRLSGAACMPAADMGSIGHPAPEIYCDVMPCGFMSLPRAAPSSFSEGGWVLPTSGQESVDASDLTCHLTSPHLIASRFGIPIGLTPGREKAHFSTPMPVYHSTSPHPNALHVLCTDRSPTPQTPNMLTAPMLPLVIAVADLKIFAVPLLSLSPQKTPSQPVPHW